MASRKVRITKSTFKFVGGKKSGGKTTTRKRK